MNCPRPISGVFALLLSASVAMAQAVPSNTGPAAQNMPAVLQNVGFEPPLNAHLPLDLAFRDETGRNVQLREYFTQKPVLLALVYYGCPMLCNQTEQGVVGSLRMLSFNPGRDYEVVFVSFDPRESPGMAAQKKESAMTHFRRPETASGWHFLTGTKESIDALTKGANFRYSFDQKSNLFAHASGIMLLTPDGRISRYFYGVEYPSRDVRLGLVDASEGKIGTPVDRALLFCYQYDPTSARYSASILKIIRLAGVLTILGLVAGMLIFRRRDIAAARTKLQGAH
jgi:protein SCO1/2